ncbi:zeatin O-glucosyltransferase [Cryptomeria japonica]|uniref:zeatin O-glucosyltransferase n=1 Tax=Cryptomeria japonica TaxID=3369 RepID=UPI0027DA802A|nr:zeatin O-glucosyltransferase [Cryptomeria japonica]
MDSDANGRKIHVVVVPLPAQGHLNQLLHFSRAIAERGVTVSFVAASTHIQQVQHRVDGWDPHKFDIQFRELPMPHLPGGEPDLKSNHMFPVHLIPLFEATEDAFSPNLDLLVGSICSESNNRVVIVYDGPMGWVQTVATKYGIPAYVYSPAGAYPNFWFQEGVSGQTASGLTVNISYKRCLPESYLTYAKRQHSLQGLAKGHILNTFSAMESTFISRLREEKIFGDKPVWTVGPLLPHPFFHDEQRLQIQGADIECLRWLDRQAPASVLYVSFGSMSSLPKAQVGELADWLERCGQPFLWVLRISDAAHFSPEDQSTWICECLPDGYERRLEGWGYIARDWAPQLEILLHKSTGGFLSHCGGNSTLESISVGVPMVAWPLHSEQFANSALITRELKVGVQVKEWRNADENELVVAEEVEKAVKLLMVSEEGMEMRQRAQELRYGARMAIGEGGSSRKDLDSLLYHFSHQFSNYSNKA